MDSLMTRSRRKDVAGLKRLSRPRHNRGASSMAKSVSTAMVRSLDAGRVRAFLVPLLGGRGHSLRGRLRDFARDHRIAIEGVAAGD